MTVPALNSPPLVAAAGAGTILGLPSLERTLTDAGLSWAAVRGINALAYLINVAAVSVPGRLDSESADALALEGDPTKQPELEEAQAFSINEGRTLLAPAGWAFAIWGPIYIGELVFVGSQLFSDDSPLVRQVTAPFVVAQLLQSLWCASFRPRYSGSNAIFISTAMLSGAAYSLSKAHSIYTAVPKTFTDLQYYTSFLPMSLHFGWLTAAALVNLNGAVSSNGSVPSRAIAALGHISVVAAAAVGAVVSARRSAPVYGGVISWALAAVADGMNRRLAAAEEEDDDVPGTYGAKTQRGLSLLGAIVSGFATIIVAIAPKGDEDEAPAP